uniref:hypothetical protein n=1 Tax=Citrobacter freundii TaxID=546 RepID=UPI001C70BF5D
MINKKTLLICVMLFVAGGVSSWFYESAFKKINDAEECTASIVTYNKDYRAHLTIDFLYTLEKKTGVMVLNGEIYNKGNFIGSIRRDVSYIWSENQNVFHFTSIKVHKIIDSPKLSDQILSEILPDFYVYPDKIISYSILPQGKGGFMFTVGERPVFICSR